jgi:hypothetical protein
VRPHPLPFFTVISLSLHAAVFVAVGIGANRKSIPVFDPSSQTLAGDTLDVEPPALAPADDEAIGPTEAPAETAAATATPTAVATPMAAARRFLHRAQGSAELPPASPPAVFGAVGVRFATDLATTFTRAFPQAGSADSSWSTVAFGSAGRAELTLVLDDDGHLAKSDIAGSPSLALRQSIERTLVLLAPRTFTARGAVTRLSVAAHVSRDSVHDGFHGDVFALSAGSFSGEIGTAFFALPPAGGPGRRVDVQVRLLP